MNRFYLKWLPVVDRSRCTGCNRCVETCGPSSLEVIDGLAVLARPNLCGSDGHCIPACPEQAMQMQWVELEADRTRGRWRSGGRAWAGRVRGRRVYD